MNVGRKLTLIVVACVALVTILAAIAIYYYARSDLLTTETNKLIEEANALAKLNSQTVTEYQHGLQALSRALDRVFILPLQAGEEVAFDSLVEQHPDGAWRNRLKNYDGSSEAGIFLPPEVRLSAEQKRLYLRSKRILDVFGGAITSSIGNVWLLARDKTVVIFDKVYPSFVLQMQADIDYTNAPWVTLGDPATNLDRGIRWTSPLYDPAVKQWMISVLMPVDVDGRWIGTIGRDIKLYEVLPALFQNGRRFKGEQVFLLDAQNNFIIAGPWQKQLEADPTNFKFDISNESDLVKLIRYPKHNSTSRVIDKEITLQGRKYLAVDVSLSGINWRYFRLVPMAEILTPLQKLVYTLIAMVLATGLLTGALINFVAKRNIVNRLQTLADAVRRYGLGELNARAGLTGNDEIASTSHEFDAMADKVRMRDRELYLIMNNIPGAVSRVDKNLHYVYVSDQYAIIFGKPINQIIGRSMPEVVGDEIFKYAEPYIKHALLGERVKFEIQRQIANGEMVYFQVHLIPDFDQDVNLDGFLIIAIDLTERKLIEEARWEVQNRLEKIANRVPGVVYQFRMRSDGSFCFPFASEVINQVFRVSPEEVREDATKVFDIIYPDDYNDIITSIQISAKDFTPWHEEFRVQYDDGEVRWLFGNATPEQEEDGAVLWHGFVTDITERKRIEQDLKDSEYRWKFAIEGSGDGVWDVNVQTQEASYSKRWKEMLGFAEDEQMNNREEWISRIHVDDRAHVLESGQAYLEGKTNTYVVEYRLQCKDGQYKWMLSRGMVVSCSEDGKPLRMIGTQTDITERKNAQLVLQQTRLELEESHDRFKDLYEFAPIGYLTISSHGMITQLNWRASAMLGMDRKNIINQRITQYIDESEKARWARMFASMRDLEAGEEFSFDLKLALHNGVQFYVNLNCVRMDDEDEQSMLRVTFEDITMIRKSEDELRVAAIAFESHDGLMITDADNIILKVNAAFVDITGYSEDEVVGKTPRMFSSGRHDMAFYKVMWESINKTGQWSGEVWNRRKSGDVFPVILTIRAVRAQKGVLTNYVGTFTDISLLKAANEEIQQLAFFDSLTQLPNRRLLMDRLKHALATIGRSGRQGSVLFIDLDQFKVLNDSLGHDVGDLLLQQVAERLTACVREGDTVARLGGDEYVVVLEDLSEQDFEAATQTEIIAKKILDSLNLPYQLNEHKYNITPSIGVAMFNNHLASVEELLKQADIAMYQSKKAGRNTLRFFNPQMQTSITARVALERELRKAIDNHEFQLYYQIQVDNSGQSLGAEALIRWIHPERGLTSPAQFIPLAEETGLIIPIGQWLLDVACAQIKAWNKNANTRDLTLSINISAKQFRQADFVDQVKAAIERYAIDPMQLKLELTESLLLENIEDTIVSMSALGEIGVQFSLDDFGTGYSSLQYLKKLPLYQLKIDQSFVRDIVTDSHDRSIVRTIIAMAQSLYLNVIAEGVETEEQKALLLSNGCKRYQGYLFGKPVPIKEFNAALKQASVMTSPSKITRSQPQHLN